MEVPKVTEQRRMNLREAIAWAMEGQTRLHDARVRLCIWEAERLVEWGRTHPAGPWETCFHALLWELDAAWSARVANSASGGPT